MEEMFNVCVVTGFDGKTGELELECIDDGIEDLGTAILDAEYYAEDGNTYVVTDSKTHDVIYKTEK